MHHRHPAMNKKNGTHETIIDEVRKFRDEYARQFNYDLHAMCLDLRGEQELGGAPIVSFSTKPIQQNLAPQSGQADSNKSGIAAPDSPVADPKRLGAARYGLE